MMNLPDDFPNQVKAREVTICEAEPDDVGAIQAVLAAAFRKLRGRGYSHLALEVAIISLQEIRERILIGNHVLVAKIEGEIVGTVTGIEEYETFRVCSLAVHPACWGWGIARKLLTALENIARLRKCKKLWLQTAWSMTEAIGLYQRMGFEQEGFQPCQFFGEDFLMFGKVLNSGE
jgi:ribosomal protein S18 acetylase RimI-like enzyme